MWFRDDLRIADNPALLAAAETGRPVIALYVHDIVSQDIRAPGAAQKWMLHGALSELSNALAGLGVELVLRNGPAGDVVRGLVRETGAAAIFWNRRYGAAEIIIDTGLKRQLSEDGLSVKSFLGSLLHEPTRVLTSEDEPYKVYSPFWKAFSREGEPREPLKAPDRLQPYEARPDSLSIGDLELLPKKPDWAGGLRDNWPAGEPGAQEMLDRFLKNAIDGYAKGRDFPARDNVSRLSPYLRFGAISPYQVWHAAKQSAEARGGASQTDLDKFLKELGWREFSYHLLYHFPHINWRNYNERFDAFPWQSVDEASAGALEAWQRGRTGYPIVDAGMRQLWHMGYMHNRVRMVTASFLVKHLLIDWREGEQWFWDTLVDGDPANNPASWQWVAGSGADAAPYFRVFNPILQGRKFDPDGAYVRQWVEELRDLPDKFVHSPWEADEETLEKAGVRLGENYPRPMVDHGEARNRALEAFQSLKKAA